MADETADRGHLAQRTAHQHVGGRAHASRPGVERTVLRIPEDRHGVARVRIDDRKRRRAQAGNPQHCDVLLAVDDQGSCRPAACLDLRRAFDHVRRRHDELRPRDPARALHAEPARDGGDANDARTNGPHRSRRERPGVGRRLRRRRPGNRRERVDARERAQNVSRRHDRVQPLEDQRTADLVSHLRLVGQLQQDGPRDPHEDEPERGAGQKTADRVQQSQRRDHRQAPACDRARRPTPRSAAAQRPRVRRRAPQGVCREIRQPLWRKCGASRAPIVAPTTSPPSESAVAIRPRLRPASAERATIASAIQSARATGPGSAPLRSILGSLRDRLTLHWRPNRGRSSVG